MLWSIKQRGEPAPLAFAQVLDQVEGLLPAEAGEGLVQQEHLGAKRKRLRNLGAPAQQVAEIGWQVAADGLQFEELEQRVAAHVLVTGAAGVARSRGLRAGHPRSLRS